MTKIPSYLSRFFSVVAVVGLLVSSISVIGAEAAVAKKKIVKKSTKVVRLDLYNPNKRYKDEKKEITDAASRCNTPALQKTHLKNLERAKEDGKPFDFTLATASTTETLPPLGEAYKKYITSLDFAWGAMEEPYCGFGAFGLQAASKSYNKSVERARARFLEAVKQHKIANDKPKTIAIVDEKP